MIAHAQRLLVSCSLKLRPLQQRMHGAKIIRSTHADVGVVAPLVAETLKERPLLPPARGSRLTAPTDCTPGTAMMRSVTSW